MGRHLLEPWQKLISVAALNGLPADPDFDRRKLVGIVRQGPTSEGSVFCPIHLASGKPGTEVRAAPAMVREVVQVGFDMIIEAQIVLIERKNSGAGRCVDS